MTSSETATSDNLTFCCEEKKTQQRETVQMMTFRQFASFKYKYSDSKTRV